MRYLIKTFLLTAGLILSDTAHSEDGYRLWLRYDEIEDQVLLDHYTAYIKGYLFEGNSALIRSSENEMKAGLTGLLGRNIKEVKGLRGSGIVVAGTPGNSAIIRSLKLDSRLSGLGSEGYYITNARIKNKKIIVITANSDQGVLYGTF
ncbi:MAG: alpha-glucuronidase, partial [Bacteroidales bacterium]|nr:alpha-glucuronidase [Bacteroidales bacterium]